MPITVKQYYCPVCNHQEKHSTNHTGEIYCQCKQCGNTPLYCAEIDSNAGRTFKEAIVRGYRFNIENDAEKQAYRELKAKLTGIGFKMFDRLEFLPYGQMTAKLKHNGERIKLFDPEQFQGQYVTNIGRMHDWEQAIYANKRIKEGYYLELL